MTGPSPGPSLAPGEEWMACRVCRRSLERLEDVEVDKETGRRTVHGVVWDHTGPDREDGVNHPAEPVPYSELGEANVRLRCDFCLAYDPIWELPVNDFEMPMNGGPVTDWGSTNAWAACDSCADLINRGDWPRLTRQAAEASARDNHVPVELAMRGLKPLYRMVRKHQAGPVRLDPLRAKITADAETTDGEHRRAPWR